MVETEMTMNLDTPCILDRAEKPSKRVAADPAIVRMIHNAEEDAEIATAYAIKRSFGVTETHVYLTDGCRIVYHDFGGLGETYYYNRFGHCTVQVID
jgi:hypothetical protein